MSERTEDEHWQQALDYYRLNLKAARLKESLAHETAAQWTEQINWFKRKAYQVGVTLK